MPEISSLRIHSSRFLLRHFTSTRNVDDVWMIYDAAHVGERPGQYTQAPAVGQEDTLQAAVSWCDHVVATESPTIPHEAWADLRVPGGDVGGIPGTIYI